MKIEDLSKEELQKITSIRLDPSKTKPNMKRLNRIYNKVTGLTYEYCMCDKSERAVFYDFFYKWYDKNANR